MSKVDEKEYFEAWKKYSDNFNSLPRDVRKTLPDLFTRVQETTLLIKEQEKVLRHLKERRKIMMQHALDWYNKKGIMWRE